jgi:phenylpropionate dioxygenase-like ring-hydroxylating dioxygenase large terminal subunit
MLSQQDNAILTRTGPNDPMGKLFRRFWQPILLPEELPEPDCPPVRVRVLGEDLVAFRDSSGRVGFFKQACPHRGASMFFGRNEEDGLRCVYHGWKFDVTGECVDMPSEPAESNFKTKVRIGAYPAAEYAGIVWIYMGPADKMPGLPQYEWTTRENPNIKVYKWVQESNYTQSLEGNIDTAHIGFLHRTFATVGMNRGINPDEGPMLQVHETDFGFIYGGRRNTHNNQEGKYYWRLTPFVLPTFTEIPSATWEGSGIFVIPRDDESCWWFTVSPSGRRAAAGSAQNEYVELIPGTWRQAANSDNDYQIDREMQRTHNYTGLKGNRIQDAMVTETMGKIYDRSREHLGTSDKAVIYMRRQLIRVAQDLENGIEPPILKDATLFRVRPVDIVTDEPEMVGFWQRDYAAHRAEPVAVEAPVL